MPMPVRSVPFPLDDARAIQARARETRTSVSRILVDLLGKALEQGWMPAPSPSGNLSYLQLTVPADLRETLSDLGRRTCPSESEGRLIGRLVLAALHPPQAAPAASATDTSARQVIERATLPPRPIQLDLADELDRVRERKAIGLIESATGTGKGLVIAAAAKAAALRGQRALITSPSHQINQQIAAELSVKLQCPDWVVVYGRGQFYSPNALLEWLDENPDFEEAGRVREHLEAERALFQRGVRSAIFLRETLAASIPSLPTQEVALAAHHENEAQVVYQSQFELARARRIVLASHAMVGMELYRRRLSALSQAPDLRGVTIGEEAQVLCEIDVTSNLGAFDVVLVDEAHALEDNLSSALSEVLPLNKILRTMRRHCSPSTSGRMQRVYERAMAEQENEDEALVSGAQGPEWFTALARDLLDVLQSALKTRKLPEAVKTTLKRYADVLRQARSSSASLIRLEFSPSLKYPQIFIGPLSVSRLLALLWAQADHGAAFSATLYLQDRDGSLSARSMAMTLRIPAERAHYHLPLVPRWCVEPVTLHRPRLGNGPRPSARHELSPRFYPDDEEGIARYLDRMGLALRPIVEQARGGTLVLCTSHQAAQAFAPHLPPERLIVAVRGQPMSVQIRAFQAMTVRGLRPIWLATGPAWTGMNIYDRLHPLPEVESDTLLTDLIMTRLPFGLSRSAPVLARRLRMTPMIANLDRTIDCAYRCLQGIGRLVRREGLRDRHLWILDPRAFDHHYGHWITGLWKRFARVEIFEPGLAPEAPAAPGSLLPRKSRVTMNLAAKVS